MYYLREIACGIIVMTKPGPNKWGNEQVMVKDVTLKTVTPSDSPVAGASPVT